jgi:Rrf2 family protein
MSSVVKFSEAASLALHAMGLFAADRDRRFQARDIALALPVSSSHLAKVLQRLAKMGLIESTRGRGGGFTLARVPEEITLLDVYEAVEGPLDVSRCLFSTPRCNGECLFGAALGDAGKLIRDRLAKARLSELTWVLKGRLAPKPRTARRSAARS